MINPVARHFLEYLAGVVFLLIALWLAGCVTRASQPAAPLPAPGHALVYDFLVRPDRSASFDNAKRLQVKITMAAAKM